MAKRIDTNQPEIVETLRRLGASVHHTHTLGQGFPDVVVAFRGRTYLAEIKDGKRVGWKFTPAQKKFRSMWNAPIAILDSVETAVLWIAQLAKGKV